MAERVQQSADVGVLNGIAAALLAFEAVLGTVAIGINAAILWKAAGLVSLALSMLFELVILADVILPWRKGLWRFDVPELANRHTQPSTATKLTLLATTMGMLMDGDRGVIGPKKRSLRLAVILLIAAIVLGAVGMATKG